MRKFDKILKDFGVFLEDSNTTSALPDPNLLIKAFQQNNLSDQDRLLILNSLQKNNAATINKGDATHSAISKWLNNLSQTPASTTSPATTTTSNQPQSPVAAASGSTPLNTTGVAQGAKPY